MPAKRKTPEKPAKITARSLEKLAPDRIYFKNGIDFHLFWNQNEFDLVIRRSSGSKHLVDRKCNIIRYMKSNNLTIFYLSNYDRDTNRNSIELIE